MERSVTNISLEGLNRFNGAPTSPLFQMWIKTHRCAKPERTPNTTSPIPHPLSPSPHRKMEVTINQHQQNHSHCWFSSPALDKKHQRHLQLEYVSQYPAEHLDDLHVGLVATKPVFGVSDKARFKPVSQATETS